MLYRLLTLDTKRKKERANIYSISTARLSSIVIAVANGFGGNKSSNDVKLDELLPFPLDEDAAERNTETEHILKELIRNRRIPVHVIAAVSKVIKV